MYIHTHLLTYTLTHTHVHVHAPFSQQLSEEKEMLLLKREAAKKSKLIHQSMPAACAGYM